MRLDMETNQIGSKQSFQKFALPGADAESFRIRPGNMPKDGDTGIGAASLDELGQECQVIIIEQHDGIFVSVNLLQSGVGKLAVHRLVGLPILRTKMRSRVGDVAQRP